MIDPRIALLVAVLAIGGAIVFLWPDRGLIWTIRRGMQASQRVLAEDALKHLFDCEYKSRVANLQSVSGALAVSGNRAAEILQDLESHELIEPTEGGYTLTGEGRSYALRIVRIHRLWERYLSDETGFEPAVWHQ